jgi:lysophospholipase L1-like esterase
MKKTCTTMVTAAAASWMLLAAPGCGSDSTNEPPDHDAGADTSSGADTGVDTGPVERGPPPVPTDVVAAGVRWVGRVDTTTDAVHPRFSWSGTGFVAQLMGTSLSAQLKITGTAQIFKAVIDDVPQAPFTAAVGTNTFPVAMGLTSGAHKVELYRQTEGAQGETQLMGLTTDGTMMDPPAGPGRLIEVIGDSITCGYGDLGMLSDAECYSTESHWDTYEAVAARMLSSEVSTIAASGRGVVRNYGGDMLFTMPMVYNQTLTNPSLPDWDFHIEPQAVVINLGTNDISNNKGDPGDAFRDTYVQLLTTIRTNYPDAWIVAIIGPLLSGTDLTTIQGHIKDAVDMRTAAGDTKVEFFNMIQAQSSDKFACQYHPNVAENLIVGTQLAGELSARLGW